MAQFKSPLAMDVIRAANAKLIEAQRKAFKPEPNIDKPLIYLEIGRYVQGSFKGLFTVYEFTPAKSKHDKPERKRVAEGIDINGLGIAVDKVIRRRVFK
jgi:hypothetical protein